MAIELNGSTGITTPGLINTGTETIVNLTTSGNTILGDASTDTLNVGNGGLVKDASGNVGIGTASPTRLLDVSNTAGDASVAITSSTTGQSSVWFADTDTNIGGLYYEHTNNAMGFRTNDVERMRIDSSGNLGLGVTPSAAWVSTSKVLQINGFNSLAGYASNVTRLSTNAVFDASNEKYGATGAAAYYQQGSGAHSWYTAPSGTAGNAITFTTAMTLDASSNLAIAGALSFASFLGGLGKTGSFFRNSGSASGTQAITGVGFRPSTIIFFAAIDTLSCQSMGFTDATNGRCMWMDNVYATGGGSYAFAIYYIRTIAGNGALHTATIASMDADGFTLNWTRTNYGSGGTGNNITVNYLAFR